MRYKQVFTIIFLIVCILSISSVQAADLDNQTTISTSDINDNAKSSEVIGNFTELDSLISNADTSSIITLDKDYSPTSSEVNLIYRQGINVNKSLTIDGNGYTIYGDSNRIFQLTNGATLTLMNICFNGGNATQISDLTFGAGSVALINSGNVIVDNTTFKNIGCSIASGSSIFYASQIGSITISNSLFENCRGNQGLIGNGGGTITVRNSTFLENEVSHIYLGTMSSTVNSYNSMYLFNSGNLFSGFEYYYRFNYNIILTNSSSVLVTNRYSDADVNFDYNYWGTNDNNKVNSLFTFNGYTTGKTSNYNNIYLAFEGTQNFTEESYGEYSVYFNGTNANQLQNLEASISLNPIIGTFSPNTIIINSTPTTFRLNPSTYGNATISVGKDDYKLLNYNISIIKTFDDYNFIVNSSDVKYGENLTVDVSLTDVNNNGVTGIVNLTINNNVYHVNVENGRGTINIDTINLIPNNYVINVTYISTDSTYRNATNYTTVTINKLSTILQINVEPLNIKEDEFVIIHVALKDENGNMMSNEQITLIANDLTVTTVTTNSSGEASYTYIPNIGDSIISASYSGSNVYNAINSENVNVYVEPKIETILVLSTNVTGFIYPNESVFFTVTLTDQEGNPLANKNVNLVQDSVPLAQLTTNELGQATYTHTYESSGSQIVLATFAGDENYSSVNSNRVIVPVLTGNNFADLALLIDSVDDNSIIVLNEDFTFDTKTDYAYLYGIDINKNITIDGNGHTISGSNMSGFFNINGVNVTLRNINFIDGCTIRNAAIYVNDGSLTIENSTMNNIFNYETIDYGIETFTIEEIVEMGEFLENYYLTFNALPSVVPYEGKFYSLSVVSYLMGQAILNIHNGNNNPVDTRSVGSPSNPSGYANSDITLTEDQYTTEGSSANPRTAILQRFVNYINTNGIAPNFVGYSFDIYYTSVVESSARILSYYAINNQLPSTTNYIGYIRINSYSYGDGVAIQGINSNLIYKDSNFTNIVGLNINGVLHSDESVTLVENCNFENNIVKSAGGIYVRLGTIDIINSTFINNSAAGEGFGGVLNSQIATINIESSKFYNNTATGTYGQGGVILSNQGSTTINNSIFVNNKASATSSVSGGGVIYQSSATLIINNSTFIKNSANASFTDEYGQFNLFGYGGAIALTGQVSSFILTNSTFENNYAAGRVGGGAISNHGNSNNYVIDSCVFNNNSASSGAAILFGGGGMNTQISNSNFTNNHATLEGGAIYGDFVISNSNFINNSALNGGVISGANSLSITNSSFISNNAFYGGIIFGNTDVNAQRNTFINNTAVNGGFIYYRFDGVNNVNFNYNIFVNNIITGNGTFSYSERGSSNRYNLEYNYWGINQNPLNDNFNYNATNIATISINNYINLTILGNNSTYTTLPTNYTILFIGENAELLPDFKTTVITIPNIGEISLENIFISSDGAIITLYPSMVGNSTIVVGYEYNNLTTLNLEVIQLIRKNYTFSIIVENITYGQDLTINFILFDEDGVGLNETINYILNNQIFEITLINGEATRVLPLYSAGSYNISSEFISDDFFYNNATTNASFNVFKAQSSIDINVDDIIFGEYANITAIISNLTTGNITFIVNGISQTITVVNGQANLIIPNLNVGNYTVDVYYNGDGNFETAHANSSFNVNKIDTELTLNIGDAVYGNNILGNLTLATVNGDRITGTVTIIVNGRNYIVNVVNGEGNFTFEPIATGQYTVTATYEGSENYNNVTASTVLDVAKSDSDILFDLEDSYLANENIVLSVILPSDATGQVIFTINGNSHTVNVENGIATVTVTGLSYGNYELTANYSGDNNYNPEILSTTINVRSMESSFDISVEDIIYGESLIIVADLDVKATGTVLFTINNRTVESNIVNGKATAIFNGLNAGDYDLTTEYSGDDVYVGLSKTTSVIVNKAPTNIEIVVGDVLDGQPVTIIAIVAPNATGNVTFSITGLYTERNRNINDGNASWLISPLERGAYTIIAQYDGDNNYLGSNTTYLLSVNQVGTTLNVSVEDSEYGEDVIVNIRLTAEDNSLITAWVYVTVDDTLYRIAVYNGTGRQSIGILEVGSHEFNATYSGYSAMRPSYDEGSFTISRAQSNISVELGANNYTIEDTIVLNISAPSDATGQVTVVIGNITAVLDLNNGYAIYNFRTSTPGEYSISISYSGDNHYNPSQRVFNFSVSDSIKINIEAPDITMYYRDGTRFVVTVTEDNIPVANRDIVITINGVNYTRTTDSQGVASMAINLNSGRYEVIVSYGGVRVTSTINVVHTISGNDITKIFRNGTQYYAAFVDSQGNPLANTNVTFNINGVMYYRQTNNDGVARLNINLNPGEYIITAINPANNEYHSNIITVLPSLVEANDLVMYFQNGSRYTVRVLGDDGNPLVGATVSFNINGVFYHRVSDSNGIAGLNINLNPGEYTITAEYNGLRASNTITVLPTLTGEDLTKSYGVPGAYEAKLVDGHGNPIANVNITYNINGVFYNRITDSNGISRLNINLMSGEYIITAYYGRAAISNTVTVLSN